MDSKDEGMHARLHLGFYKHHNEGTILKDLAKILTLFSHFRTCNSQKTDYGKTK